MSNQNLNPEQMMLKILETVQETETKVASIQDQISSMQGQMSGMQGQMASMQAEINQNSRDIVFVKSLSISLENKLGEVVTRLSNVEAKVDAVDAKVDTVIARVDIIEAKVDTNIKEVKALREDFRDQEHYINVLDLKVAKMRNDYYELAHKVNQSQQ